MATDVQTRTASAAIIIEWENVLAAELSRSIEMLRQLRNQTSQLGNVSAESSKLKNAGFLTRINLPLELLILFDDEIFALKTVEDTVLGEIGADNQNITTRFIPAPGYRYYALKNYGATHTKADLLIFLDSDVIPQPEWLLHMLGCFADPQVKVVAGYTFIDPVNLYAKIYSLSTLYDLPAEKPEFAETDYFFGNNIAFRRGVFSQYPFPNVGTARISSHFHVKFLNSKGIRVYRNSAAQTSHPAPFYRNFFSRAFSQGHDDWLRWRYQPRGERQNEQDSLSQKGYSLRQMIAKGYERLFSIVTNRKRAKLPWWGVPLGLALMGAYYISFLFGYLLTGLRSPQVESRTSE